jgi:hypothetical protein
MDCQSKFNTYISDYQHEINRLLNLISNSNIKEILINKDACGAINSSRNAILTLTIMFKSNSDTSTTILTKLKTNRNGIKPNSILNTINFLEDHPTPIHNILYNKIQNNSTIYNIFDNIKVYLIQMNKEKLIKEYNGPNEKHKSAVDVLRLILDFFITNKTDILSNESLRKILIINIFIQLRESKKTKLIPELEDLRKIAILKLQLVNYNLIEKFIKIYSIINYDTDSLHTTWIKNYDVISRTELCNIIGNCDDIFWLNRPKEIINKVMEALKKKKKSQEDINKVLLFLIFGDYGIEPGYYSDSLEAVVSSV